MRNSAAAFTSLIISFLYLYQETAARTAQENLEYMRKTSTEQGALIDASDELFLKYVKSKHSKYSVVAIFNAADPKHGCEICQEAKEQFIIAAHSYAAHVKSEPDIFFVVLDYDRAAQSFVKMRLNHAPEVVFFTRDNKKRKRDTYDIARYGMDAAGILKWLHERSGVKVPLKKPIPWVKVSMAGGGVFLVLLVVLIKPGLCLRIFTSSTLWGVLILISVLTMISGQMWNFIRNASNHGRHRDGEIQLILASDGAQYRYETYLVMALNGAISTGFILLNQASKIKHLYLSKGVGFFGLAMVFIFFGYLLSVFRMKSHGYPYYLLFK